MLGEEEADEPTGHLAFHWRRHDPVAHPDDLGPVSLFVDPEVGCARSNGGVGGAGGGPASTPCPGSRCNAPGRVG